MPRLNTCSCGVEYVSLDYWKKEIELRLDTIIADPFKCKLTLLNEDSTLHCSILGGEHGSYPWITFCVSNFPNTELAVSHSLEVAPVLRGKGIAQLLMEVKKEMCRSVGFTGMISSVNVKNEVQQHILTKTGWRKVGQLGETTECWYVEI